MYNDPDFVEGFTKAALAAGCSEDDVPVLLNAAAEQDLFSDADVQEGYKEAMEKSGQHFWKSVGTGAGTGALLGGAFGATAAGAGAVPGAIGGAIVGGLAGAGRGIYANWKNPRLLNSDEYNARMRKAFASQGITDQSAIPQMRMVNPMNEQIQALQKQIAELQGGRQQGGGWATPGYGYPVYGRAMYPGTSTFSGFGMPPPVNINLPEGWGPQTSKPSISGGASARPMSNTDKWNDPAYLRRVSMGPAGVGAIPNAPRNTLGR